MADAEESWALPLMEPRFVDKGLRAPARCPNDPQAFLQRSSHPYSPFVGNALTWESYVFDDGTTYEGLCREEVPHGKGVMMIGKGGGGFRKPARGDTYEGEFYAGFAHGLGQYVSNKTRELYRGEFYSGKRQGWGQRYVLSCSGCGMSMNFMPYHQLVQKGENPNEAWKKTKDEILSRAKYGTWKKDYFAAEPDEKGQRFCHINEIKGTLQELEAVLTQARMFQWKPDGEVTYHFAQDANGAPVNVLQDPLHYPYGTKFMAPGPMGQCHNCPDDPDLKRQMLLHAQNYQRIHDMYNLDYDPPPGSDLYKALKMREERRQKELAQQEQLAERTASARAARRRGKASGESPADRAASMTMGLTRAVGKAWHQIGHGLASWPHGRPRLSRPGKSQK